MTVAQPGIFALGTAAHIFLEFLQLPGASARALASAAASLPVPTVGGVNLTIGFRPQLWRALAPDAAPGDAQDFDKAMQGSDGFMMPATQADLWLWFAGPSYDHVWDSAHNAIGALRAVAKLERELGGWSYWHSRDLTGFEDGTENPQLLDAPAIALVPEGRSGAGASILLFQQWRHETSWMSLSDEAQEKAMGRTKAGSIEFEESVMPPDSHVARAKDVVDGEERKIFRRNVAYGDVRNHGTVFVGFSAEQSRLDRMLRRMAGMEDGIRDALTRHTTPLTGAYYVIPPVNQLVGMRA